jgi:hypothetical protein
VGFLGGSVAYLWGQVTLWSGRADNAWGSTRQYNKGPSFETNYTQQVVAYNDMVAQRDFWTVNAGQAYDGGSWGVGNLWSTDAHNDPNVWTNRFNAGVVAAQPAADTSYAVAPPARGFTDNGQEVVVGTLQVGPAGTYLVWGSANFNAGNNSLMVSLRAYTSPNNAAWTLVTATTPATGINSGSQTQTHVVDGGVKVSLPAGGWVQFRILVFGSNGNSVNSNGGGLLRVQFIPTPANPH